MSESRIAFAHLLRGTAAAIVVFFHYAGVFWAWPEAAAALIDAPPIGPSRAGVLTVLAAPAPYFSLGHTGVALFFLVSGFVIPGAFDGRTRWAFVVSRAWRLWPTYAAGLTLTIAALAVSGHAFGRPLPFTPMDVAWHYVLGARDLAGSASIDGVVWTLEAELRFYAVCLLIAPWLRARSAAAVVAAVAGCVLVSLAGDWLLTRPELLGMTGVRMATVCAWNGQLAVFMFAGTFFRLAFWGRLSHARAAALTMLVFATFGVLWRIGPQSAQTAAGLVSYGVALAIFAVCFAWRARLPTWRPLNWLAEVSYPLYVVHALPGYVVMRLMIAGGAAPGLAMVAAAVDALAAAAVVHRFVEVPTHEMGRRLARRRSIAAGLAAPANVDPAMRRPSPRERSRRGRAPA